MANSKDCQVYKDNYLDTSTRTKNAQVQYESSNIYYFDMNKIKNISNVKFKRFITNKKILSKRIFM